MIRMFLKADAYYYEEVVYWDFKTPLTKRDIDKVWISIDRLVQVSISKDYLKAFRAYFDNVPFLNSNPKEQVFFGDIAKTMMGSAMAATLTGHPILTYEGNQ